VELARNTTSAAITVKKSARNPSASLQVIDRMHSKYVTRGSPIRRFSWGITEILPSPCERQICMTYIRSVTELVFRSGLSVLLRNLPFQITWRSHLTSATRFCMTYESGNGIPWLASPPRLFTAKRTIMPANANASTASRRSSAPSIWALPTL
jgi:hypothetical protein